jgi:protein involved in temperature-dependent protein secretion
MSFLPQALPQAPPRRRAATWWTSDAARDRQRLVPPWIAVAFGLMVAGGLALLFPFRGLEAELGRAGLRPDALQIAYLETWLAVRPERAQLRYLLAQQLVAAGDFARARLHLRHLAEGADTPLRLRAELLDIDIALRELEAMTLGHPERPAREMALRERFGTLLARDVPTELGLELAQRAVQVGAGGAAIDWFERLLARRPALSANGWEVIARQVLQLGEHDLAARLLMQAREVAPNLAEQRRLFIAALRALQAASRFDEALALAERHLGALAGDTATLEYLTRLALAANRPDIAQRYAILMLKIALLPAAIDAARQAGARVPEDWLTLNARIVPQVIAVQAMLPPAETTTHQRTARLPFDDGLYTLSYDVFVANANLDDALVVARSAVRQVPNNLAWRRRLAQAADWAGQPEVALEQWHAIARLTGTAAAWSEVRRRAVQVRAAELWVEALKALLRFTPIAPGATEELAAAYEEIGDPDGAIALLRPALTERGRSAARRARLERLAVVAERAGDSVTQRAALRALLDEIEARPAYALQLAALEYSLGREEAAFAALQAAEAQAGQDVIAHRDYWRDRAELARATGRRAEALRAYRLLLAAGESGEDLLIGAAGLLEDDDPRESARLYDLAWQRHGRPEHAAQALYLLLRTGDRAAVRGWLARQTPAQLAQLERSARFLMQRATVRLADGQARDAVADARRALALQPTDAGAEALLVWTLIAARDAAALRAQLAASAHGEGDEPLLWGPFAAGWLALQEPRRALRFLRLQAQSGSDPLWMLSYADALDQLGSRDLAWGLRRQAWLKQASLDAAAAGPQERLDLQRRLLPLAVGFAEGDAARARLRALLAADRDAGRSATREAVLGYWLARERSEVAQAWLLGQYAQSLERPAWAELAVALAEDDRARLETLLDTLADWLPLADRIEAADRVGRRALAQSLAFDGMAALPDNDDLHRRFTERAAGDRTGTAAPFTGASVVTLRQRPLDETTWTVDGSTRLSPRLRLGAAWSQTTRRSTDPLQLFEPPRTDTTAQLELGYDLGNEADARFGLQQRDGLARAWGWRAQGEWRALPRLSVTAVAGQGQAATDNAYLRAGAVRDVLGLAANLRLSQREFAALSVEASRFSAQGGGAIGDGRALRIEVGHRLRTEYPDLSVRASLADLNYSPASGVAGNLLPLLPPAARATASNAQLLPASTQQAGLALVFGETARERYTRAWRPFGVLSVTHDRNSGNDYAWTLGAGGSVFGTDALSLFAAGGSGLGVQAAPFHQVGLRYQWLH